MNAVIDAAINRYKTTLMVMVMVVVAGLFARNAIPVANEPNIQIPFYIITVIHEGITPEDAERLLVMPLEVELRNVEGIDELTSYASEGAATVMVEFDAEFDLDRALQDVREAVDNARPEMPGTIEEPIIRETTTEDFPILQVNLVGEDVPERVLYNLAIELKDEIEIIPEVLDAELQGHREEVLEAIIDPNALEAYRIANDELINTIVRNNRLIPAGSLDTGEGRFSVKVPSVIEQARDVFDLPVRVKDDAVVTLGDVATVRRTFKDRTSYARVNGEAAISLNILKRADANIVDTIAAVKQTVDKVRPNLPAKVSIYYSQDQAPWTLQQVTELQGNILTALALVMIVVVAAMGFRSGVIVGLGIPVSFLFSMTLLYLIGYTFNFMVMFGMLLGLGMLIDGAIVVTEYADRKMVEGFDRRSAYALAAKRMLWPVTASIATTLAAFLPLMFWPGVPGQFMRYLPVTVFTVLTGSLLYALIFGPVLGALFGRPGARDARSVETLRQLEEGDPSRMRTITGLYARILRVATRHAGLTLALALAVVCGTFWAYGEFGKGVIFFSDTEGKFAVVTVRARGNLAADEIDTLVGEVEERILQTSGILDVNTYTSLSGISSPWAGRGGFDVVGRHFIELHDENDRERTTTEILEDIRQRTGDLAGIAVEVRQMEQGPAEGKPIEIEFASQHKPLLEPAVEKLLNYMQQQVEGLRDIEDTRFLPGIEWKLSVDRAQAALYGADVSQVGVAVQLVTNGVKVGEYRPDNADDAVDIRVRYPLEARGLGMLDELRVSTAEGLVPISNFVQREAGPNVDTIQRSNGVPVKYIRADVAPGVLADNKVKEIESWLAGENFDPRLSIRFRGTNEDQQDSIAFVSVAFLMSLILMFILLVTQFNSFYQSLLILFAVVLSTAGVLLGLLLLGQPFSAVLTGIGVVALAGIVVNNNIVLIDTYNHLRREHPELDYISLIVRTGAQRLRPVTLTTLTTVFGLLPLASNTSIDLANRAILYGGMLSAFWVPLAQAIVSGLTFATLLTLVVTPAMLAVPHQFSAGVNRLKLRIRRRLAPAQSVAQG